MAAASPSPALSSNSTDNPPSAGAFNFSTPPPSANAVKSQRGLNKPKCIKCGNVARSRCPFHSCKSCCSKAQNPCEIHVLKGSSNAADKAASSNSAKVDPQPTEASNSGNAHRIASLRQLSNTFSQFNNLSSPVRARKPLTRKDAQLINEWRFLKLKEFRDRNIEAENEAFDRYMKNVSLLEQVFCVNSALDEQEYSAMDCDRALDDCNEVMVAGLKQKLRSNPARIENFRKRVRFIVDQGLRDLSKSEHPDGGAVSEPDEMGKRPKRLKSGRAERAAALSDLIDKLNRARNLEELKVCSVMKSQLRRSPVDSDAAEKSSPEDKNDLGLNGPCTSYFLPKWFTKVPIDQESLSEINTLFSSLEEIEDL